MHAFSFKPCVHGICYQFGTFFAVYEPWRRYALTEPFGINNVVGCTLGAATAGTAASLVGVPADVIKKRVF